MELGEPRAGQLLIATEPGRGGYFERSVVLLLDHNDEGSLGVCLHKVGEMDMVDSLEHFSDLLTPPAQLFEGGPVSGQTALGLAQVRNPWEEPPGWRRVFAELLRGSWFRTHALAEEIFGTPENLWRRVLRRIGGGPGTWSTWSEHPEWN